MTHGRIARLCIALLIGVGPLAAGGCGRGAANAPDTAATRRPLTIGAYYWPGQYWIDIANDRGWFREAGVDVRVVDTNGDYFAAIRDLAAGHIDIHQPTLYDVILLNARGADLVVLAVGDQSAGADGIVARPWIDTVARLRGRRVGVARGTYSEYLLSVVLRMEGITFSDVTLVDIRAEEAADRIGSGAVDAVVTWEPALAEALERVKGRKLWDSSAIPGISPTVIAVRRSVARERRADLQRVMRAWKRATEFLDREPEAAYAIVARVNHKTIGEVRRLADLDRRVGLRENLHTFSLSSGFESIHGTTRVMTGFLLKGGLIASAPGSTDFLDPRLLKDLP